MSNFDEFDEFDAFDEFEEFGFDFDSEIDYGYVYFPDASKIFDYMELDLLSNVKYKILGFIDEIPIIQLTRGRILELMENELEYIKFVSEDDSDEFDSIKYIKYIKFIENLWLDNGIDLALKYKDEEAFKKLAYMKYPKDN